MDPDIKELISIVLKNENRLVDDMRKLTQTVDSFIASSDAYVQASHERMLLVEKQLDALVRALTAKPMNGKTKG